MKKIAILLLIVFLLCLVCVTVRGKEYSYCNLANDQSIAAFKDVLESLEVLADDVNTLAFHKCCLFFLFKAG